MGKIPGLKVKPPGLKVLKRDSQVVFHLILVSFIHQKQFK